MVMNLNERHRRPFRDTPCLTCWHGHSGANQFWSGNTRTYLERCGEWLSWFAPDFSSMLFGPCDCPEWRQPYLCRGCGKPARKPFQRYLNGVAACSAACSALGATA